MESGKKPMMKTSLLSYLGGGGLHKEMVVMVVWTFWRDLAGPAITSPKQKLLLLERLTLFSKPKTRHAHQISALTLAKLYNDAFLECDILHTDTPKEIWRKNMINKKPNISVLGRCSPHGNHVFNFCEGTS